MICEKPRTTAIALGSTVAIMYSLCALAFALLPDLTVGFINSVSHGVNLQALEIGKTSFTFGGFLTGLICITLYAILAGYVFGAIRNRFQKKETQMIEKVRSTSPARA